MGVPYADCFDKESLANRLNEAREEAAERLSTDIGGPVDDAGASSSAASDSEETSTSSPSAPASPSSFDRDLVVSELRSLRASELRTKLSAMNVRWGGMIEKEELVRALADAMEVGANFSPSGALRPGDVTDITDEILSKELSGGATTPLLLDVYATWCGPCQMMAPQLKAAAEELGADVRVAKIDSDKYTAWASRLRVEGLPTLIVFDGNGKELERVEGAMMKEGLVQIVKNHLRK